MPKRSYRRNRRRTSLNPFRKFSLHSFLISALTIFFPNIAKNFRKFSPNIFNIRSLTAIIPGIAGIILYIIKNFRKFSRRSFKISSLAIIILSVAGDFFVHQDASWQKKYSCIFTRPLEYLGERVAFITDGLGWTGHDASNSPNTTAPNGEIYFAGIPKRVAAPAPNDITLLKRGEFQIGWSPSLGHAVWVAYHVPAKASHKVGKRPTYMQDRHARNAPSPSEYSYSGYDRGHLAPNYAIASRFGPKAQRQTFYTSNLIPQKPTLNRGAWREVEHLICQYWTARYGEIWIIAGCISPTPHKQTLGKGKVDIPEKCYMVVAAQDNDAVRVLAMVMDQEVPRGYFPRRSIVSIDELERQTGLDFFPDMASSMQTTLEATRPNRLWPIRWQDMFDYIHCHVGDYSLL